MSDSILEELNKAKSDLAKAEEFQELMKKGNAIIRKGKDVVASLVAELKMTEATAEKLIRKDFAGRTGFPTYKLTNNNANIKRLRDRVKMLEDKWGGARDQHSTGETEQYEFTAGPGGTIEVNYSVDRVQILFAGKPDADIRTPLKQNGWRWSPTEGAWQRKITPQAISNAVHLLKATKAAAATEALEVASEEIIEPNTPDEFADADPDWDPVQGRKYKMMWDRFYPIGLKEKFHIVAYSFDDLKLLLTFKNGTGELDLSRRARAGNYSPNLFDKLQNIAYWIRNAAQYYGENDELIATNAASSNTMWTSHPKTKGPITTGRSEFLDELHPLDLWKQFNGDKRWYRKFEFSAKEVKNGTARDLMDRGIKERTTDRHDGGINAIISVKTEGDSIYISELYRPGALADYVAKHPSDQISEPNAPEDFDQAIFDQLDPHAGWVGHQVKERVVKNQIYKLLTGPEAEKATETERLFEKYKAKHPSDSNESDDLVNPPEEKPLPPTDYAFFTRLALPEFAEVREKLEAFDPFTLTDWEYHQYEDLSKKHGKVGALQLIMNNAERDWKHVSKKLAAIGRIQDKIETKLAKSEKKSGESDTKTAKSETKPAKTETLEHASTGPVTRTGKNVASYPSHRYAKPKERDIIIETFGEENLPGIESVLGDVIDLYPHKQFYRLSGSGATENADEIFQTIGASKSAENYFYVLGANGNVYLEHNYSMFPAKVTNEMVTKKYPNQFELNKAIERMIEEKGDDAQNYSSDEKAWIRKYSGYGGLEKFGTAGKGAFFEYYTPTDVIAKMWALAYKYGYNNGPVLEPSVATGEFLQFAKPGIRIVGFEISNYSAAICKVLYPAADIRLMPFEQNFIKNNFTIKDKLEGLEKFDLVIGNPPYGDFSVVESRYMSGMGEKKHVQPENYVEYFLRRGVDLLNPGGLLIYIIGAAIAGGGKMFLDQGNTTVKEYLAQTTELIDAYRLPDTVFERTGVTSDIIVLKKK